MKLGDHITVVGKVLTHAFVVRCDSAVEFYYAASTNQYAPVYREMLHNENITWCRGHIAREDAADLMASAALARGT